MKAVATWADSEECKGSSTALIHETFAHDFMVNKEYPMAEQHYLKCSNITELVSMLCAWISSAPTSEHDLFITRTVLRLVSIKRVDDGANALQLFLQQVPLDTPLVHFLLFMIKCIQSDAGPLFQLLRQKYAQALSRDPALEKYLKHIAKLYFGISAPQGILGNLMNSFFS